METDCQIIRAGDPTTTLGYWTGEGEFSVLCSATWEDVLAAESDAVFPV